MKTSKLNELIGGTPSHTSQFTPALNNIRGINKPKDVLKKIKPAIKQYGDKGYKPSNGIGVGM